MDINAFLTDMADILGVDVGVDASFSINEDDWDSLSVVSTIAALDDHFGVTLEGEEIVKFSSLADLIKAAPEKAD